MLKINFLWLDDGEWKMMLEGEHSHPYETQPDAIDSAIEAAHNTGNHGQFSQVVIQGESLLFRIEWVYGMDPYPPPG